VSGKLGDDALHILATAEPECLWRPLREMYAYFISLASTEEVNEAEMSFVDALLEAHRWQDSAETIRKALAKRPYTVRRYVNGARWPARPDGLECPLAGFWFCTGRQERKDKQSTKTKKKKKKPPRHPLVTSVSSADLDLLPARSLLLDHNPAPGDPPSNPPDLTTGW
jgi:hypothetical protein